MASTRRSARLLKQASTTVITAPEPAPTAAAKSRKRAASNTSSATSTPPKKRSAPTPGNGSTPIPSAVSLIASRVESKRTTETRFLDTSKTNAPLLSPETSRVIKAPAVKPASKLSLTSTITTDNLLDKANKHLVSVDSRIKPIIDRNHCRVFAPEGLAEKIDPFESLASGIISQQVSGAAAKSIKNKFVALFDDLEGRFPQPSAVVSKTLETLRTAGLSQRKAEYIYGLAEKFTSRELTAQMLHDASYEEVLEKLIAVRGLGRWSVEMFACFALKRTDVFSTGDLGVQRGMAAFVGRDVAKLKNKGGKWKYMSEKEMEEISEKFSPYRSLFMWYMWRVEETDVSTME